MGQDSTELLPCATNRFQSGVMSSCTYRHDIAQWAETQHHAACRPAMQRIPGQRRREISVATSFAATTPSSAEARTTKPMPQAGFQTRNPKSWGPLREYSRLRRAGFVLWIFWAIELWPQQDLVCSGYYELAVSWSPVRGWSQICATRNHCNGGEATGFRLERSQSHTLDTLSSWRSSEQDASAKHNSAGSPVP
jgi:hypothetical protein